MIRINYILLNILIFSLGIYTFITGYFPTTVRNTSSHVHVKSDVDRKIHRSVFMVIDALREDLLNDSESMPFLNSKLNNQQACFYSTKVEMPTVTMPRIKAFTTGTIPNFIDVILNFESGKLNEDNILQRAFEDGQKLIFFGDETWLKLFPNIFIRSEGTTSFYVTDYTEVDNNVTRHLDVELEKEDWDIMILHYLGLDHIGHLEGPTSSLMKPKLIEMNDIIANIYLHLKKWEARTNKQSLFLVTSDHGMKDSGGHGGSTHSEIMVPLVAVGPSCKGTSIAQIDIAPTLAVLFGLPFPKSSIGKLIPELLHLNQTEILNAFEKYYNHLVDLVTNSEQSEFTEDLDCRKRDLQTETGINNLTNGDFYKKYAFYSSEIRTISDYLISSRCIFDLYVVSVSAFLLWTTSLVVFFEHFLQCFVKISFWFLSILCILCCIFHVTFCYSCNNCSEFCNKWIFVSIMYLFIALNLSKIITVNKKNIFEVKKNRYLIIVIVVHLVQTLSTLSSSYVEEEQHTWFYYTSSFLIFMLYKLFTNKNTAIKTLLHFSILTIVHRLIRDINISYVDVKPNNFAIWLYQKIHVLELSIHFILGLVMISLVCKYLFTPDTYVYVLINLHLLTVYLNRSASGIVLSLFPLGVYRQFLESWTLFLPLLATVITHTYSNRNKNSKYCYLHTFVLFWVMLCTLLLRPHNVVLIPALIYTSCEINKTNVSFLIRIVLHCWLGKTFYFYQGTTNNIATIDVASGYAGQASYDPVVVGFLILVHTFSMPVLSHLLLAMNLIEKFQTKNTTLRYCMNQLHSMNLLLIFPSISFYCLVMILHRTHLFIWSVFSPKLLFDTVYVLVIVVCNLLAEMLGVKYNYHIQANKKHSK